MRGRGRRMLSIKQLRIIEEIAKKHDASLVVGNAHRGKGKMASNAGRKSLRQGSTSGASQN